MQLWRGDIKRFGHARVGCSRQNREQNHQMLRALTLCQAVVCYFDIPDQSTKAADEHPRMVFLHGPAAERHHRGEHLHVPPILPLALPRPPALLSLPSATQAPSLCLVLVRLYGEPPIFIDCHPRLSGTWP